MKPQLRPNELRHVGKNNFHQFLLKLKQLIPHDLPVPFRLQNEIRNKGFVVRNAILKVGFKRVETGQLPGADGVKTSLNFLLEIIDVEPEFVDEHVRPVCDSNELQPAIDMAYHLLERHDP